MPQNKRESLIYTVMMCFMMVICMSIYNVSLHLGEFSLTSIQMGWIGFPIAYLFAMCCDWFLVSHLAKKFAFTYLVTPTSSTLKKVVSVSCCMVIPMVLIMSFYGSLEACLSSGDWNYLWMIYLTNIPRNFILALPLQLLIAGPIIRYTFRKLFPIGSIA